MRNAVLALVVLFLACTAAPAQREATGQVIEAVGTCSAASITAASVTAGTLAATATATCTDAISYEWWRLGTSPAVGWISVPFSISSSFSVALPAGDWIVAAWASASPPTRQQRTQDWAVHSDGPPPADAGPDTGPDAADASDTGAPPFWWGPTAAAFVGDSTSATYAFPDFAPLTTAFTDSVSLFWGPILNAGHPGDQCRDVAARISGNGSNGVIWGSFGAGSVTHRWLHIWCGVNDLHAIPAIRHTAAQTWADICAMAQAARAATDAGTGYTWVTGQTLTSFAPASDEVSEVAAFQAILKDPVQRCAAGDAGQCTCLDDGFDLTSDADLGTTNAYLGPSFRDGVHQSRRGMYQVATRYFGPLQARANAHFAGAP